MITTDANPGFVRLDGSSGTEAVPEEQGNDARQAVGVPLPSNNANSNPDADRDDAVRTYARRKPRAFAPSPTRVAVIGAGRMGGALTARLALMGIDVLIASRDRWKASEVARMVGGRARHGDMLDVAHFAHIVLLAVPYGAAPLVVTRLGDLTGKIVVDLTNPIEHAHNRGLSGLSASIAECLQKIVPSARVVKAFNTILAHELSAGGMPLARKLVYIAGDDKEAVEDVRKLAVTMKLNPVGAGRLFNSRFIESVGMMTLKLVEPCG